MGNLSIKKVCGFNISSIHFSMMILPYIKKELDNKKYVITILEENIEKNINQVLSKISINDKEKENILNINWKETDIKESKFKNYIIDKIKEKENIDIIIYGKEKYINDTNKELNKILDKKLKKNIKIIKK